MTSRRRPAMREMPVRTEKMAVDRASRRPWPDRPSGSSTTGASATFGEYRPVVGHALTGLHQARASISSPRPMPGFFYVMPNIKQQERRVGTAARQRLENLRWRSASKTLFRRLERALEEGDEELISTEHRLLVQTLDRAAAQRAIHPNKAARKKAQAAKLVSARASA